MVSLRLTSVLVEARYSVLSPADSPVNLATAGARGIGLNAPESARNRRCFLETVRG
jgi:hypothetical protein